ncbi:hypothetical protein JW906_02070 [bacterium]|nr:hypothetical protein [bacterium]
MSRLNGMGRIILFILLVSNPSFSQPNWSKAITIAGGSTPYFDIDRRNGDLHILTMLSVKGVYYTRTDSLGNILEQGPVPGAENDEGNWDFGAVIAVDNQGYPHVCYRVPHADWHYDLYYTTKTPTGWSSPLQLDLNVLRGYQIRIAIDRDDRIHIVRSAYLTNTFGTVTYYRIHHGSLEGVQADIGIPKPKDIPSNFWHDDRLEIAASPDGEIHMLLGCPYLYGGGISYYKVAAGQSAFSFIKRIHSSRCPSRNGAPDLFIDSTGTGYASYGALVDNDLSQYPSIRFVQFKGSTILSTRPVNVKGDLQSWKNGNGWGLSSIAATPDGQYVLIAYVTRDAGTLYTVFSSDFGKTWTKSGSLANSSGGEEGRNRHLIRSYKNHFYLVYPENAGTAGHWVKLRIMRDVGELPPSAVLPSEIQGFEGTAVLLDASESRDNGQNAGIVGYDWDWNGDGIFDQSTETPVVSRLYPDDFEGNVILRVRDRAGFTASTTAAVVIDNVNPVLDIGSDRTIMEGDTVHLHAGFTDPGSDTHTFQWKFNGSGTDENQTLDRVFPDDGFFRIECTVRDDDGGSATKTIYITVMNVAPVARITGPASAIPGQNLRYLALIQDPGNLDVITSRWDLNRDGIYEMTGQTADCRFDVKGFYEIRLRVEDGDGGTGTDTLVILVTNGGPLIMPIPDQTVDEGGTFSPISLLAQARDPVYESDVLDWRVRGNVELLTEIKNNTLNVSVPGPEWSGQEKIWLICENPAQAADSTGVTFTVRPVNDPPRWTDDFPDIVFPEDSTVCFPPSFLLDRCSDADDSIRSLHFSLSGNQFISWSLDSASKTLCLNTPADWFGEDQVDFVVMDAAGATDRKPCRIVVTNISELPRAFALLDPLFLDADSWPDTLQFTWMPSLDVDSDDDIYYEFILERSGETSGLNRRSLMVSDTTLQFVPDPELPEGTYLWWVKALNRINQYIQSQNMGILNIGQSAAGKDPPVPQHFDLFQNVPNPFNPSTRITYHLARPCEMRLSVFNTRGQIIRILESGRRDAGVFSADWEGTDEYGNRIPSGIYLIRLEAGGQVFRKKALFVQ